MSPRAAWRLERLGYGPSYDYVGGKVDWLAAGLPSVRAGGAQRRALDGADPDPPSIAADHRVEGLMVPEGRGVIVVNEQRMVLGRIPPARLGEAGDRLAEAVMDVGPTTVRAHEPLDPLLERMARRNVNEIVVTTPDGELLGVVWRSTGRRAIPSLALRLGGETPSWLWHPRTRRRHCLHEVTVENWGVDGDLPASEIDVGFEIDI